MDSDEPTDAGSWRAREEEVNRRQCLFGMGMSWSSAVVRRLELVWATGVGVSLKRFVIVNDERIANEEWLMSGQSRCVCLSALRMVLCLCYMLWPAMATSDGQTL